MRCRRVRWRRTARSCFGRRPTQLGSYQFDVLASDGALEASRSATLNVVADPVTTTRISGQVLQVNGQPLANMPVEIGAVSGLTMPDGSFTLDLGSGPIVSDTLKIRGELFPGPLDYPFIAEKLAFVLEHAVFTGVNNVIDRPIYLPSLDLANGQTIDPAVDTNVTTAAIPDASVLVKAGTLMNQQGTPFTGVLSITEVPVNLTPAALPPNLVPDLVVTVQPGEMVFASPAPMTFPNRAGWPAGTMHGFVVDQSGDRRIRRRGRHAQVSGDGRDDRHDLRRRPQQQLAFPRSAASHAKASRRRPAHTGHGWRRMFAESDFTSQVELHSGVVLETHDLVRYRSLGTERGVTLRYDSLRADPRPIVHFGYDNVRGDTQQRMMARPNVRGANDFIYAVPGAMTADGSLPTGAISGRFPRLRRPWTRRFKPICELRLWASTRTRWTPASCG